ncbi:hypothetical protein ONS95_000673 [Cadophora gregata]|uniref:uncharacterized protein n=1 Tax=Cadophora gregata TaxID=51156 RepID=UPI0026DDB5FE|nr:uncharacterized protein ONS95_000673 [Cadophora gregata]KAK0125298.1 hypothetical protein ONS96_009152 [Cadophora gregata f. sp. sojae]KAK0128718.1 hypothetical protein ONS95_000673 [Cadophora gregata]
MSKITSKNLHYDDSLPPFLARLRANNNAGDGRHEYSVARPKKARTAEDEAEDEPVYFDEVSGETLSKSEWEEREAGLEKDEEAKDGERAEGAEESAAKGDAGKESKEKVAAIGASKKRKAGKVVGGEDEDEIPITKTLADKKAPSQPEKKVEKGKSAKKGKKIKLSFGDDE